MPTTQVVGHCRNKQMRCGACPSISQFIDWCREGAINVKSDPTLTEALKNSNLTELRAKLKQLGAKESDFGVFLLIADMLDEIAAGKNRYMIIGAVTNLSAFSLTIKGPEVPAPMYGPSLAGLSAQAVHAL
jgi:hypothetical protein